MLLVVRANAELTSPSSSWRPKSVIAQRPRRPLRQTLHKTRVLNAHFISIGGSVLVLARSLHKRRARLRDSEGRRIDDPPSFDVTDVQQVEATHVVEFKARPFGVLAYAPSANGKGAMVWELGRERYPGDPQGRARRAGVCERFALRSVNGVEVATWAFEDIMDLLGDKILDNSSGKFQTVARGLMENEPAALPLRAEFVKLRPLPVATAAPALESSAPSSPAWVPAPAARQVNYPPAVDEDFVQRLMEAQETQVGKAVLPLDDAVRMVRDVTALLKAEATLQRADFESVVVVGDLHGQFADLLRIFRLMGQPGPSNPYLFNGDFVDRGEHSLEVIFTLLAFKLHSPRAVCMNRGNHEAADLNLRYGFAAEIRDRYGSEGKQLFDAFSEAFRWLPLAHVLNSEVIVVHGGLPGPDPRLPFQDAGGGGTGYNATAAGDDGRSGGRRGGGQSLALLGYNPDNVSLPPRAKELTLEDIAALPRGGDPATDLSTLDDLPEVEAEKQRLIVDLLWADPRGKTGYGPSYRVRKGCYIFGPDVTKAFLKRNGLRLMIRSHEVKVGGYEWTHPECITVFSAPNYLGHARNKGAVVRLERGQGGLQPSFVTYEAGDS